MPISEVATATQARKTQGWEGGTCSLESYKSAQDSSRRGSSVISESRLIDSQKAKELP